MQFSALLHTGLSYRGGSHEASVSSPALNSATSTPRCSTRKSANELPSPETPSATAPSTPTTVQPDLPQGEDLLLPPADLQYLVIPEEDPYCVINDKDSDEGSDNNDEDEDSQLLEDVIGDEDDDEDEDEDEVAPKSKFSSPWPLPIWLKTAFELCVEELSHRGSDGLPPLYRDHQTFWFPCPATYFLLQNSSPSSISMICFFGILCLCFHMGFLVLTLAVELDCGVSVPFLVHGVLWISMEHSG